MNLNFLGLIKTKSDKRQSVTSKRTPLPCLPERAGCCGDDGGSNGNLNI